MLDALIIGGDGKIGQALKTRLISDKKSVVSTTRRWPPYGRDLDTTFIPFDLRYPTFLPKASITYLTTGINGFRPCDADPVEAKRINTTLLVEAARYCFKKGSLIVYLSSSAAETHPDTVYGTTKREAEEGMKYLNPAIYRFGPVAFPGREVWPNPTYHPMNLSTLVNALANLFNKWESGLHCLYNKDWKPEWGHIHLLN